MKLLKNLVNVLFSLPLITGASGASAVEKVVYFHNDALGSPVAATNEQGQLLWTETYEPYGKRVVNPASDNKLWYTGKPEEAEFGLNYFGARWYDPLVGRFQGVDPVDFQEGNIQSFNRYAYANNNPYKYVDPDGEWAELVVGVGLVFVGYQLLTYSDYAQAPVNESDIHVRSPRDPVEAFIPPSTKLTTIATRVVSNEAKNLANRYPRDRKTGNTLDKSAKYKSERDARNVARTKLGKNPVEVEQNKWRSQDGKWQYRGKPEDLAGHGPNDTSHVHLERLNPRTGEVLENWHLRW